jgi:hypothetical protein
VPSPASAVQLSDTCTHQTEQAKQSANIQCTFRSMQGTFREHSGWAEVDARGCVKPNCKKRLKKVPKVYAEYDEVTRVPKTRVNMTKRQIPGEHAFR